MGASVSAGAIEGRAVDSVLVGRHVGLVLGCTTGGDDGGGRVEIGGVIIGATEGAVLSDTVGEQVGTRVGCVVVGVREGLADGRLVGICVGELIGLNVIVGTLELGCPVG